jgi:hypothetical protein
MAIEQEADLPTVLCRPRCTTGHAGIGTVWGADGEGLVGFGSERRAWWRRARALRAAISGRCPPLCCRTRRKAESPVRPRSERMLFDRKYRDHITARPTQGRPSWPGFFVARLGLWLGCVLPATAPICGGDQPNSAATARGFEGK